jgi:hypothetical protein
VSNKKPEEFKKISPELANLFGIDPDSLLPVFPKPEPLTAEQAENIAIIEARRDLLFRKLESGYEAIEKLLARADYDPDQARLFESFWGELKTEYDLVCDELMRAL